MRKTSDSTALASRMGARELVALFAKNEAKIRRAFRAIAKAEAALNTAFTMDERLGGMRVDACAKTHSDDFGPAGAALAIGRLRRKAWEAIAERLELTRIMSTADAKRLADYLKNGEMKPLNERNLRAFAARFSDVETIFDRSIKEVFDWLRPRERTVHRYGWKSDGDYKTNRLDVIGPRVIVTRMVNRSLGSWDINYGSDGWDPKQRVIALERVFLNLDGQGSRPRGYYAELHEAIKKAGPDGRGETAYFAFRCCFNGALHLRFRRLDLLAELNRRGGAMVLPVPAEVVAE